LNGFNYGSVAVAQAVVHREMVQDAKLPRPVWVFPCCVKKKLSSTAAVRKKQQAAIGNNKQTSGKQPANKPAHQ
jgi:hypothetical protein